MVTFPVSFSALAVRGSKIGINWSSRSRSGEHSADGESAQVFNQEFHFDGLKAAQTKNPRKLL